MIEVISSTPKNDEKEYSPQEIQKQLFRIVKEQISKHIIPLFQPTAKGGLRALGTGVFTKIDDKYFILTASHVVKGMKNIAMYVPGGNTTIRIRGLVFFDENDKKDVGMILIEPAVAVLLQNSFAYLPQDQIVPDYEDDHRYPYMMIGYPSKNVKQKGRILTYNHDIFLLHLSKQKVYNRYRFSNSDNYIMDLWGCIDFDGKKAKLKRPHGMSGCGLWYVGYNMVNGEIVSFYHLIGIMTEIRTYPYHVFIGTKIKILATYIDNLLDGKYGKFE